MTTTEAQDATESRDALAAAAMLAGERWARRPDTRAAFRLMRVAALGNVYAEYADRWLARLADEAESRAVLAAVLAPRVDGAA